MGAGVGAGRRHLVGQWASVARRASGAFASLHPVDSTTRRRDETKCVARDEFRRPLQKVNIHAHFRVNYLRFRSWYFAKKRTPELH